MRSRIVVVVCLMVVGLSVLGAAREYSARDGWRERTPAVRQDQPETGHELAVTAQAPVTASDARTIAATFVSEHAASGACPEWAGAEVGEAVPFFSTTSPQPLAYEFAVVRDGVPQGAVFCGGTEGTASVISYHTEGRSIASALRQDVEEAWGRSVDTAPRYFYGGGSQFGIEVRPADSATLPAGNDQLVVIPEDGTILYSVNFMPLNRMDWDNRFRADFRVSRQWVDDEREVRREFLRTRDRRIVQADASSKPAKVTKKELSTNRFANFYQVNRKWSNGTCFTGCSPIAAAILFEFWDRGDFPKMIGSDSSNRHTTHTNGEVVTALESLRKEMGTFCSGTSGSTYNRNLDDGTKSYARARGYKKSTTDNNLVGKWSTIIEEINAGRPLLLSFRADFNGTIDGHTVVPYKYSDSTKNKDDEVCVRSGWSDPKTKCYRVDSSTERWTTVTVVKPKK